MIESQSDVLDAGFLTALADLAETRGKVRFTPGGGVLFDAPMTKEERLALPTPRDVPARFLNLPADRLAVQRQNDSGFDAFVARYTVPHLRNGYRLVVVPMQGGLSAAQLRALAEAATVFGHGTVRATADISVRLPNVPTALLRPLYRALTRAGLTFGRTDVKKAA